MTSANCTLRTANGSRPVSRQPTNTGTKDPTDLCRRLSVYRCFAQTHHMLRMRTSNFRRTLSPRRRRRRRRGHGSQLCRRRLALIPPVPGRVPGQTASHLDQCSGDKQIHISDLAADEDDNRRWQDLSAANSLGLRLLHLQSDQTLSSTRPNDDSILCTCVLD